MKREESAEQRQIKLKLSTLKALIDQGQALPDDVTEYLEAREEQRRITREELTPYFASEEFALKQGAAHDTGSAAFYRPYTPKGSNHWINEIFHADWTDPSNPKKTGTTATDPSQISAALTPFYSSLYAQKPSINPERPLATLENGNRVLPTTAAKCGAPILSLIHISEPTRPY